MPLLPGPGGRRGIHEVFTSLGGRLGVEPFVDTLGLPEAPRYVVLLVDGLGEQLLREHAELAPFLSSLHAIDDVVCGVPSTTATSLTSLGTGLRAGQHGVVGYTSRVPATGRRMNSLTWDQPVAVEDWQPYPTALERILAGGVNAAAVNDARFEDSGLTLCSQRGVPFHGVRSTWERLDVVVDVLEEAPRGVVYAYESDLDHTGHKHGCTSPQWREVLATIDMQAAALRDALPEDAVLVVTADHGMIDVPREGRFDVDEVPALREDVELLAGEARFRHLYTRPGAARAVADRWSALLGDRAIVRTQDGVEDWFGPIDTQVRGRIGDVVVAALDDFAMFSTQDFALETQMTGFHGSVTEAELRVPVLVAP